MTDLKSFEKVLQKFSTLIQKRRNESKIKRKPKIVPPFFLSKTKIEPMKRKINAKNSIRIK